MLLKLPHSDASPLHPVMLQVTPPLLGSFVTVAVKSWLPLVRRLAVDGTTETETGGRPLLGAVVSEPHAVTRNTPDAMRSWRGTERVFTVNPFCGSPADGGEGARLHVRLPSAARQPCTRRTPGCASGSGPRSRRRSSRRRHRCRRGLSRRRSSSHQATRRGRPRSPCYW